MLCCKFFLRISVPVLTKVLLKQLEFIGLRSSIVLGKFLANTPTVTHIEVKGCGILECFCMLLSLFQYKGRSVIEVLKINFWYSGIGNVDEIAYLVQKVKQQDRFTPSILMFCSPDPFQVYNVAPLYPDVFYSWLEQEPTGGNCLTFQGFMLDHMTYLDGLN